MTLANWVSSMRTEASIVSPPIAEQLDRLCNAAVRRWALPGLVVAVSRGGQLGFVGAYGHRELFGNAPMNCDTRFHLGSTTKQVTAAAIMLLRERTGLSLDTPISDWFPEAQRFAPHVTVKHLLNHTSGIASYTEFADFSMRSVLAVRPRDVVAEALARPLAFDTGTSWQYNNTGYMALALIAELVSGTSFHALVQTELLKRLGLESSGFIPWDSVGPNLAQAHSSFAFGAARRAPMWSESWAFGAGDLTADAADMLAWGAALLSGRVVSPESLEEMTQPTQLADGRLFDYGYGLMATRMNNGKRVAIHGGGLPGMITQHAQFPDDGLGIAVFANVAPFRDSPLTASIYAALTGEEMSPISLASPADDVKDERNDERCERWLTAAIAGELDRQCLTREFDRELDEHRAAELIALRRFGQRAPLHFVQGSKRAPVTSFVYRCDFERKRALATFSLVDGTICDVTFSSDDSLEPDPPTPPARFAST